MIVKTLCTYHLNFPFTLSGKLIIGSIARYFLLLVFCSCNVFCFAEGTKELMPTAGDHGYIQINDRGRAFATYNAPHLNRLYIHICTPGEIIYFGFKQPDNDINFRLKDPAGNIVVAAQALPTSGAGYIPNYAQAAAGTLQLVGATGYDAMNYNALVAGDYYIEFQNSGNTQRIFDFFDITVAAGPTAKKGRVWSYSWDINTKAGANALTGKMYILSTDSIVTSIDFNGMQPFGAVIAANSTGLANSGNLIADRKSKVGNFSVPEYKIFLNNPDENCYPTGSFGTIIGQPIVTGCDPANRCINIIVNKPGKVEIVLDLNATTGYQPNSEDFLIIADVISGPNCIPWDSKNGLGNLVTIITGIPLEINYLNGVTHLPLFDVEANPDGYIVELIRPAGTKPNLYWDDSAINNGTAIDNKVNLTGCASLGGCHRWKDRGDNSSAETINTWWYPNIITKNLIFDMPVVLVDADIRNSVGALNDSLVCETISSFQLSGNVDPMILGGAWIGGTGTFSPSRNIVNPTYAPSQTEKNAGSVKLYFSSIPNGACPPARDSVKINFEKIPEVRLPLDQILCSAIQTIPTTALLSNATTGIWTGGNGLFTAATNPSTSYTVSPTDTAAGNIYLIFTSTGPRLCHQADDTLNITFEKIPQVQLTADKTICSTTSTISLTGLITNATTGIWTGGNGTFTTATSTVTDYTISPTDISAGTIHLIHTSTGIRVCPQEDDTINITFNQPVTFDAGSPITICAGVNTINIAASGDNTATYTWSGGGGTFVSNNALITTYTPTPTESTTSQIDLTLTAQKGVCPNSSDILSILITPLPAVYAGNDTLVCKSTTLELIGTAPSTAAIKWYAIPSLATISTQPTVTLANIQTTSDYVMEARTSNNCMNSDTISIQTYDLPNLNPGGPFCYENGLTLQANPSNVPSSVPAEYIWTLTNPNIVLQTDALVQDLIVTEAGIYKLSYRTASCSKEVLVTVHDIPTMSSPDSLSSCIGNSISLYTTPISNTNYSWFNQQNQLIQTGSSITVTAPSMPVKYLVLATDNHGCTNKDSVVIFGAIIPNFNVTDAIICSDSMATFKAIPTNIPSSAHSNLSFEWKLNNLVISTDEEITTNTPGQYVITSSYNNCSAFKTANLTVHALPLSSLPSQYVFCSDNGNSIELDAGNAFKFHWLQSNETTQTINVSHPGKYDVVIYNSHLCKVKVSTLLVEECQPTLYLSNAFSPNKDGLNDIYEVFSTHIGTYSMSIFNRWGEIIFQTTDKNEFWDGYYNGKLMQTGVYPYVINYTGNSETFKGPYSLKGSVTVVN